MKKTSTLPYVAICATATILLTTACAHYDKGHHGKKEHRFFKRIDRDNDGFISSQENQKMVNHLFDHLDDNEDGIISKEERPNNHHHQRQIAALGLAVDDDITREDAIKKTTERHQQADTNNDGKLSLAELKSYRKAQRFNRLDSNNDGNISKEEFLNMDKSKNK